MAGPHKTIQLTPEGRGILVSWTHPGNTPRKMVARAQIILLSDSGMTTNQVVEETGFSLPAVYKWKDRFDKERVEGLQDLTRPGQPRKLSPAKAKELLKLTVEQIPHEATHWSLRLMAKYAGVTIHQVQQASVESC